MIHLLILFLITVLSNSRSRSDIEVSSYSVKYFEEKFLPSVEETSFNVTTRSRLECFQLCQPNSCSAVLYYQTWCQIHMHVIILPTDVQFQAATQGMIAFGGHYEFDKVVSESTSSGYPLIIEDDTRWRAFWWYHEGSVWPPSATDVLGEVYGSCDSSSTHCFGRLPQELSEIGAEMLGKDSNGTIYRWTFNATNKLAHAVWSAFHDHVSDTVKNSDVWNPRAVAGNSPTVDQDSFMYRREHGIASLLIDNDNCDGHSSLSLGHGMCGPEMVVPYTHYAPENKFGVDLLFDPAKQTPSPHNGLTLYFRDDDDCTGVQCSPGKKCVDGIATYTCVTT